MLLLHSLRSLSYDWSRDSSKATSPKESGLAFPLLITSIFSFLLGHPVTAYIFFLVLWSRAVIILIIIIIIIIIIITIIIIGCGGVLTGVLMKSQVFLNVTPSLLVNRYPHFKKSYCLRSARKY